MSFLTASPGLAWWPLALTTLFLSLLLVGLVRRLALRSNMLDRPGERSSHTTDTPTGGGAGLYAAMLLVALLPFPWWSVPAQWVVVLVCMLPLVVIGWVDDRHDLAWTWRLSVQFAVSLGLVLLAQASQAGIGWPGATLTVSLMAVATFYLVWMMNMFNFMDGSDGMAGGQGMFCGGVIAVLFLVAGDTGLMQAAVALAAACLGFLAWNHPPARIFLGDTGSIPLGLAIGALLLLGVASGDISPPVALLVPATFMVDAGMTLLWRVARGERWYTAHRNHLYQRLIRHGWSHGRVLWVYQGANVFFVVPMIVLADKNPGTAWLTVGICVTLMVAVWTVSTAHLGGVREQA
ncbi:glycosyltransferase family 4 protein [Marinihelvus fidelis]|uniref:Glycosyltransferase family 4 protein n=1 Tax=Marinihelvus fidelis TaxID=2613842 RepID=A0A5N0TCB2_9GAMM|nr:glycosyltransferase family 4 protein [Marinihelvus fidelis]KAA9132054.1 glycosyltransferase family 4 protein [Marinihelvus fidelis]